MSDKPSFQLVSEMLFYLLKVNDIDPSTVSVSIDFDEVIDGQKITAQITREFQALAIADEDRELHLDEDFRMHAVTYRINGGFSG
jgi:hypothetical protein